VDRLLVPERRDHDGDEIRGVLRAVNLDKGSLRISPESGGSIQCSTPPGLLDDIIGHLINSQVVARGTWIGPDRGRFQIQDIHGDEDE
jgi:hypothetical protein